jgi:TatA/E family protein of Tat protein translocase
MFGPLGGPELVLILVLALIVFGPRRLPEIGKSMGRLLSEFRKASHDFQRTIEDEVEAEKYKPAPVEPAPPSHGPAGPPETSVPAAAAADDLPRPPAEPTVLRDGPAPPPWTETK